MIAGGEVGARVRDMGGERHRHSAYGPLGYRETLREWSYKGGIATQLTGPWATERHSEGGRAGGVGWAQTGSLEYPVLF